jgi:hypothetical protein
MTDKATYDPFSTGLKTAVERCGLRFERPNKESMTVQFWDGDRLVFEDSQLWGFDFLKTTYGLKSPECVHGYNPDPDCLTNACGCRE